MPVQQEHPSGALALWGEEMKKTLLFIYAQDVHTYNASRIYTSNRVSVEINFMGRAGMWPSHTYLGTSRLWDWCLVLYAHKQFYVSVCVLGAWGLDVVLRSTTYLLLKQGLLVTWTSLIRLDWLASKHWDPASRLQDGSPCLIFSHGFWGQTHALSLAMQVLPQLSPLSSHSEKN